MNLLLEGAIESSLILLLAFAVLPLLRRRAAALRHVVLSAALACAALAPAVGYLVPAWQLPVSLVSVMSPGPGSPADQLSAAPGSATLAARSGRPAAAPAPARRAFAPGRVLPVVWIAGLLCGLATMAIGLVRLARLSRGATRIGDGAWREGTEAIRAEYGLARHITLLKSADRPLLVTWGLWRPHVLVPPGAVNWPVERIRVALGHELAHVRRNDWLVLLAAEGLKCVYWFNPLVWLACARLRRESEQASDDAVIATGVDGAEYATHLVAIARDLSHGPIWVPAQAIVRRTSLERRVRAMLDPRLNRRPVSRTAYAAVLLAVLAITIPIASAQARLARVTGSIVDPTNGLLPGVTLVLTNVQNQSKYEVLSDAGGRYEFVAVPPGEYVFEAKLPGFATIRGQLTLIGEAVQRDLTMNMGSVEETVNVTSSRSAVPAAVTPRPATARARRPTPDCGTARPSGRMAVGGNVRPPIKLVDVKPLYPVHLAHQGIEGTVVLKGLIGTDGRVHDLEVVAAPQAELGQAALDAVWQWEFDATLLNCTPVAIALKTNVNFRLTDR